MLVYTVGEEPLNTTNPLVGPYGSLKANEINGNNMPGFNAGLYSTVGMLPPARSSFSLDTLARACQVDLLKQCSYHLANQSQPTYVQGKNTYLQYVRYCPGCNQYIICKLCSYSCSCNLCVAKVF